MKLRKLVLAALVLNFATGWPPCRKRDDRPHQRDELDGGVYIVREECDQPTDNCIQKCHERESSAACYGCCMDQRFLCNTQKDFSFAYCDGAR